ncbi:hypothetical protein [Streptomyces sp. NPDC059176]|uniref:hypothetical protein n=1 Tax=unclassified Streptomyces TaxID=2593676 RepID=UPI00368AB97D
MNRNVQRAGVGLLAAAALFTADLGVGAAAMAAPTLRAAHVTPQADAPKHYVLDNLVEATQPTFHGTIDVLRLASEPAVPVSDNAAYYMYNPDTGFVGYFLIEGDIAQETVTDWQQAQFLPPAEGTLEVRYGNVEQPECGSVVAKVTVL